MTDYAEKGVPTAYLFPAGTAMFFGPDGEQLPDLQEHGISGLHSFCELFPTAPVYWCVWDDSRHEMSGDEIMNLLQYVAPPEGVERYQPDLEDRPGLIVKETECPKCESTFYTEAVGAEVRVEVTHETYHDTHIDVLGINSEREYVHDGPSATTVRVTEREAVEEADDES